AAPAKKAADGQAASSARTPAPSSTTTIERTDIKPPRATVTNGHPATQDGGRIFASPLARKIADEAGVDLGSITGSGPVGPITRRDVEEAMAGGAAPQPKAPAPAPAKPQAAAPAPRPAPLPPAAAALSNRTVTLTNMRRIIAQRLQESKQTIPHYQVTVEVDM